MKLLIVLLLTLALPCRAEIVALKKGDIAPFEGALVDVNQMKEFREHKTKLDLEVKQNEALKTLNLRLEEKIDFHKAETRAVEKELTKTKFNSNLTNIGYFVLGVALTSLATKFAIDATQ
jgi:hypothetical protein